MAVRYQSAKQMKSFYQKLMKYRRMDQNKVVEMAITRTYQMLESLQRDISAYIEDIDPYLYDEIESKLISLRSRLSALLHMGLPFSMGILCTAALNRYEIMQGLLEGVDFFQLNQVYDEVRYGESTGVSMNDGEQYMHHEFLEVLNTKEEQLQARKNELLDRLIAFQDMHQHSQTTLTKIESEYQTRLGELEENVKFLSYKLASPLLKTVSLTSYATQETFLEEANQNDLYLYVMHEEQLYYQQDADVKEVLKNHTSYCLLLSDDSQTDFRSKVEQAFPDIFTEIWVYPKQEFSGVVRDLEESIRAGQKQLLLTLKENKTKATIDEMKSFARLFTGRLLKAYGERSSQVSDLEKTFKQTKSKLQSKALWTLNNYEMRTRINIETETKELYKDNRDAETIAVDLFKKMFNVAPFQKDLKNMRLNLKKMADQLNSQLSTEHQQTFEFFTDQEGSDKKAYHYEEVFELNECMNISIDAIASKLKPLMGRSALLGFGRKKKFIGLNDEFLEMLEQCVKCLTDAFNKEIDHNILQIEALHQDSHVERLGEKMDINMVNTVIRLIDDRMKQLKYDQNEFTLKEILLNAKAKGEQ